MLNYAVSAQIGQTSCDFDATYRQTYLSRKIMWTRISVQCSNAELFYAVFDIVSVNASLNFFHDEFESVDDVKMIACVSMLHSLSWQSEEIKSCKKRFETQGLVPVYQL